MVNNSKTIKYCAVPQFGLLKEATSGSKNNEHRPIATTSTATIDDSVTEPGERREQEEYVESGSYPPNSINYISIGLNPTILPLYYTHHHTKTRKHGYCYYLCHCRVVFTSVILILLMTVLIHWLIWIILKKDQGVSLLDFIFREG